MAYAQLADRDDEDTTRFEREPTRILRRLCETGALLALAACGGSDEPNLLNISQPRAEGRALNQAVLQLALCDHPRVLAVAIG